MPATLEQFINDAPLSILPASSKQRVHDLARQLDAVAHAEGDRIYLDGPALRRALGTAMSAAAVERVLTLAKQHSGADVIDTPGQPIPGSRVPFPEFVRGVGLPGEPAGGLGLTTTSTLDEVKAALMQRMPGLDPDVFDTDPLTGLRAYFEAEAAANAGIQPLTGYRSWEDCMLDNGVLPACLLLLGIVFGVCLLAALASGYTLTPWLVALFWVYMGAETVALLNAINRCVYWYQ